MRVNRRYATFAWGVLGYSVLVILWGAFVRATGSGAGCGSHWPLCNGAVVPRAAQVETLIEFAHRLTSGLSVILIGALILWGWRLSTSGQPIRTTLVASGAFIILEALIGAWLVLAGLTAQNDSIGRAISVALHLINTFLLLASLALAAWWASGGERIRLAGQGWMLAGWLVALVAVLVVGMSGAVTALGDTLFPSASLTEGFRADFSPTAHILTRLRVLHPMIAVGSAVFAILLARLIATRRPDERTRLLSNAAISLLLAQIMAGALNVALLAPVWMQILHLALAVSVWLSVILLGASAFAVRTETRVLETLEQPTLVRR
ncbi:MAG: COX15/CtaA family protein [Nitrososphaerales archaeon]